MKPNKNSFPLIILFTAFILISTSVSATAENAPAKKGPSLKFKYEIYDFGEVIEGAIVEHVFPFENKGDEELLIKEIVAPCGCTGSLLSEDRIKPDSEGQLKVIYNSEGRLGRVTRKVSVLSNDPERPEIVLNITAEIVSSGVTHSGGMTSTEISLFSTRCNRCHGEPAEGLAGEELFTAICTFCHTFDEKSRAQTAQQLSTLSKEEIIKITKTGVQNSEMPGWTKEKKGPLDEKQIESIADYLKSLEKK